MNEIEEWKCVPGYEGIYQASTFGRVRSLPRLFQRRFNGIMTKGVFTKEKILKHNADGGGYFRVTLVKDGVNKTYLIHRLIMMVFHGPSCLQVDHIDEDKSNNMLSNLRYSTCRQNHIFYNEKRVHKRTSKYIGVNFAPTHGNRWRAAISINGRATHLGYFSTEIEAHLAYQAKRIEVDANCAMA